LQDDLQKNIFISPSGVGIALAMTYNGASGTTKQAMAKALELEGLALPDINSSNMALKALLENPDPEVKLTIANSLWANENVSLNPEFLKTNQKFYQAQVTNLDFSNPGAVKSINNWVSNNTDENIKQIVTRIPPNQILFLINAIYFKGQWTQKFDPKQTTPYPFKLLSGQNKQVPMMFQSGNYNYYETENLQAVTLPYGKNKNIGFHIFLPKQNSSLQAFYRELNAENWKLWMSKFRKTEGSIRLPKFKIDYKVKLAKALTALGMGEAFSSKADFSGIGKQLAISDVTHKTFVEVNEEGTEAAAATSIGVVVTSIRQKPEPFEMIVDRPFFCAISDRQTGTILFMGSIVNP